MKVDEDIFSDINFMVDVVASIHFSYFLLLSIQALISFRNGFNEYYSHISKSTLRWLRVLIVMCVALIACWWLYIISTLLLWSYDYPGSYFKTYYPGYFCFSISIYLLLALRYEPIKIQKLQKIRRSKRSLEKPVYDPIKIYRDVKNKGLYRSPTLTLRQLAKELNLNINDLSQTINNGLKKSFSDFINELRVEEVKDKLKDPKFQHLSQLGIAFDSGFNSKATFNRAFKKWTGMTPTEFLKKD
ncbi:helix-turn-helix domain-containing protein [Portibacter marinus]|uniref:helix-turn-helix domain-containing protein n=1 Tax=Portibacter marinus TaxID=2898660 RepID=UPI001F15E971|nr:helix-turn-helix domain-containing protein [Portibacter marinus]